MNETLAFDGTVLNVPGFCLLPDLSPLLGGSALRGRDRTIYGQPGVEPYARVKDATVVNLAAVVQGRNTQAGVAHADIRTGLYLNLKALQLLLATPATVAGTHTATLVWQGETPDPKPVTVLGDLSTGASAWDRIAGVIRLSFPEGLFEL